MLEEMPAVAHPESEQLIIVHWRGKVIRIPRVLARIPPSDLTVKRSKVARAHRASRVHNFTQPPAQSERESVGGRRTSLPTDGDGAFGDAASSRHRGV